MRSLTRTAVTATLLLTLTSALVACSDDDGSDGSAGEQPDAAAPAVYAGCEDVEDQEVAVDLEPAPGTDQTVDASLGRNFNAAGAPCVDLYVWDAPAGWTLDHYEISADYGGGLRSSVTSTSGDFVEALRFTPLMQCARVHGELVYRKQGAEPATFVADTKVCTHADQ